MRRVRLSVSVVPPRAALSLALPPPVLVTVSEHPGLDLNALANFTLARQARLPEGRRPRPADTTGARAPE
jgi:hypothetical protein